MINTINKVYMLEQGFESKGETETHITLWLNKADALKRCEMYAKCYKAEMQADDISEHTCHIYYDNAMTENGLKPTRAYITRTVIN